MLNNLFWEQLLAIGTHAFLIFRDNCAKMSKFLSPQKMLSWHEMLQQRRTQQRYIRMLIKFCICMALPLYYWLNCLLDFWFLMHLLAQKNPLNWNLHAYIPIFSCCGLLQIVWAMWKTTEIEITVLVCDVSGVKSE